MNMKMKSTVNYLITLLFILAVNVSYSQVEKIETFESNRFNIIEKDSLALATSEIYSDYAEIIFFEKRMGVHMFIQLGLDEFKLMGDILTNYNAKDKDFYFIPIREGSLFIRFSTVKGYTRSDIYMEFNNSIWHFPRMNRLQYKRLFSVD